MPSVAKAISEVCLDKRSFAGSLQKEMGRLAFGCPSQEKEKTLYDSALINFRRSLGVFKTYTFVTLLFNLLRRKKTSILSCALQSWRQQLWIASYQVLLRCPTHELQLFFSLAVILLLLTEHGLCRGFLISLWTVPVGCLYALHRKKKNQVEVLLLKLFPAHPSLAWAIPPGNKSLCFVSAFVLELSLSSWPWPLTLGRMWNIFFFFWLMMQSRSLQAAILKHWVLVEEV